MMDFHVPYLPSCRCGADCHSAKARAQRHSAPRPVQLTVCDLRLHGTCRSLCCTQPGGSSRTCSPVHAGNSSAPRHQKCHAGLASPRSAVPRGRSGELVWFLMQCTGRAPPALLPPALARDALCSRTPRISVHSPPNPPRQRPMSPRQGAMSNPTRRPHPIRHRSPIPTCRLGPTVRYRYPESYRLGRGRRHALRPDRSNAAQTWLCFRTSW